MFNLFSLRTTAKKSHWKQRHHLSLSKSFGATCTTNLIMNCSETDKTSRMWICNYSTQSITYTLVDAWPVVEILAGAVLLPTIIILNSFHASLHKINKWTCFTVKASRSYVPILEWINIVGLKFKLSVLPIYYTRLKNTNQNTA